MLHRIKVTHRPVAKYSPDLICNHFLLCGIDDGVDQKICFAKLNELWPIVATSRSALAKHRPAE